MNIIENKYYSDWRLLVDDLDTLAKENYIYRGQSNLYNFKTAEFFHWPVISSFNRYYPIGTYNFRTYLHQQFQDDLFKAYYFDYNINSIKYLSDSSQLERIYFLQHYGIPTCFLDFTRDPFIALYFAMSSVKAKSGGAYDSSGNPCYYPEYCYISIYCFDYVSIIKRFGTKEIVNDDFPYKYDLYSMGNCHFGFDIDPSKHLTDSSDNFNLKSQRSSFVLFDNNGGELDLLTFLEGENSRRKILSEEIIIKALHLSYNSLFKKLHSKAPDNQSLFNYLYHLKKTGMFIFNDMQGLKYDLNYFHHF